MTRKHNPCPPSLLPNCASQSAHAFDIKPFCLASLSSPISLFHPYFLFLAPFTQGQSPGPHLGLGRVQRQRQRQRLRLRRLSSPIMLPESSTTDPDPIPAPNPNLTGIVTADGDNDDDGFPFRFGFPPRPSPPPPYALASRIGPDRRQSSAPAPLLKHNSWSPDSLREETWQRRKDLHRRRRRDGSAAGGAGGRMCRSVTEEDLEELRGCIDLGFGFEEDEDDESVADAEGTPKSNTSIGGSGNKKLWELLPALDLYYAVRRGSRNLPPQSPSALSSLPAGGAGSMSSSSSSEGSSPLSLYSPGDSPREVKARLKQWAQVVACSVRQHQY